MSKDISIVIIGSGVFGLSSAYHLAIEGYTNVTVFDRGEYELNQFSPLNGTDAASTDINKLVRASYVDKVHYQELALESIPVYYEWNNSIKSAEGLPEGLSNSSRIFKNTGYIRLDDIETDEESRTLANFAKAVLRDFQYDINCPKDIERSKISGWFEKLDPLGQRHKVLNLNGVLDSFAGVADANKALLWLKYLCEKTGNVKFVYGPTRGAVKEILFDKEQKRKAVGVRTADGLTYLASLVVLAAGGWSTRFFPQELIPRLEAVGSSYIILRIPSRRKDLIEKYRNIPMINWRLTYEGNFREDGIYVFPATDDGFLKIGANDHFWRYLTQIDNTLTSVPKTDYKGLPYKSVSIYRKFIKEWLPDLIGIGTTLEQAKLCFSLVGQNNEFVIDFIPNYDNLIVSTGGGFHGFKFLPVIGKFTEGLISNKEYAYHERFKFDAIKEAAYTRELVVDLRHTRALNFTNFINKDPSDLGRELGL